MSLFLTANDAQCRRARGVRPQTTRICVLRGVEQPSKYISRRYVKWSD
jgi:hypothetical protein